MSKPNFKFFNNLVTRIQTENPNWKKESCEKFAIVNLQSVWKPAKDGFVTTNVSLYLYLTKLFNTFPNLRKYADDTISFSMSECKKQISWIVRTRSW